MKKFVDRTEPAEDVPVPSRPEASAWLILEPELEEDEPDDDPAPAPAPAPAPDAPELELEPEPDPEEDEEDMAEMALFSLVKDSPKALIHLSSKIVVGVRLTVLMGPSKAWAVLDWDCPYCSVT